MAFFPMKKKTIDNNTVDTTTTWSSSKILDMIYPIGSIIQSTTLNTEDKVKAQYGGNTWIQHSGYVLRGATSGVTANSATKDGGEDSVTLTVDQIPSHNHSFQTKYYLGNGDAVYNGSAISGNSYKNGRTYGAWAAMPGQDTGNKGGGQAHNNIPNYKSVYIWERTA